MNKKKKNGTFGIERKNSHAYRLTCGRKTKRKWESLKSVFRCINVQYTHKHIDMVKIRRPQHLELKEEIEIKIKIKKENKPFIVRHQSKMHSNHTQ